MTYSSESHPVNQVTKVRRGHLLVKEDQLREFTTEAGLLVRRIEPNELVRGEVLLNNSPLNDEAPPGETVWFRRECGRNIPGAKGYVLLRYDQVDLAGSADVQALTEPT